MGGFATVNTGTGAESNHRHEGLAHGVLGRQVALDVHVVGPQVETQLARGQGGGTDGAGRAGVVESQPEVQLLISDIGMPDMDGYDFIRCVRSSQEARIRRISVIALTAYARTEDHRRSLDAGFQLHRSKPYAFTALTSSLTKLLQEQAG
jgi:CheY-like chemotaxis protein